MTTTSLLNALKQHERRPPLEVGLSLQKRAARDATDQEIRYNQGYLDALIDGKDESEGVVSKFESFSSIYRTYMMSMLDPTKPPSQMQATDLKKVVTQLKKSSKAIIQNVETNTLVFQNAVSEIRSNLTSRSKPEGNPELVMGTAFYAHARILMKRDVTTSDLHIFTPTQTQQMKQQSLRESTETLNTIKEELWHSIEGYNNEINCTLQGLCQDLSTDPVSDFLSRIEKTLNTEEAQTDDLNDAMESESINGDKQGESTSNEDRLDEDFLHKYY